jgi:N-acetylmuramoyl-L-alanine amidase
MSKTVILDNGHGGVINNVYQTAGKRSPKWSKGVLFEGMFNRWVVNRIIEQLDRKQIPYYHICPEITDTTLETRKNRANKVYTANKNTYILSIHANAGGGKGIEGYTTKGITKSDNIGEVFLTNLETDLVGQKMRFDYSDGDKDKESNFYILRKPLAPAFLLECGFMDHETDYNNLWDEGYLTTLVNSLVKSVEKIYND